MKKTLIVLIAIGALWLPGLVRRGTAQDSIHYLVMIANQGTQISNQAQSLLRMDRHITQLTGQFEHLKESALGQIGAITDPSPIWSPCPPTCSTPRATGTRISPGPSPTW